MVCVIETRRLTAAAAKAMNEVGGQVVNLGSNLVNSLKHGSLIAVRHGSDMYNISMARLRTGDMYICSGEFRIFCKCN